MGKKEVFVSYASPDKFSAESVVEFLERRGVSCFIAPRDVDGGKSYASNLVQAIDECSAVILVASAAMNNSEHVLNEVDVIVAKKKPLIPLFVEDFEMNDDYRYYLGRTHRIIAYPGDVSRFLDKLFDSLVAYLPKSFVEPVKQEIEQKTLRTASATNTTTIFEYIPERGIMINPEDHQRNVSFRTDTFINMFSEIFDSVAELGDCEKAMRIFHKSGYSSGRNFAQRLNSRWDFESKSPSSYERKLKKWCEFDSNVGWGKFDITVHVDEETGNFDGILEINECFIVDKKSRKKVCEFVKGYCEGVIETLLEVEVELKCVSCPMENRFKSVCRFNILLSEGD